MRSSSYKIVAIFVTLVQALVASLLPLKVKGNARVLSLANALGAGVLLAAALVHLFSEAVEHMEGQIEWFYPAAFGLCGLGILATLSVEQIATLITTDRAAKERVSSHSLNAASGDDTDADSAAIVESGLGLPPSVVAQLSADAHAELKAHYAKTLRSAGALSGPSSCAGGQLKARGGDVSSSGTAKKNGSLLSDSDSHAHEHNHGHSHGLDSHGDEEESHGHSHAPPVGEGSFLTSIVLWFALSFHSVMEGIALGASSSSFTSIFIAIIAHKALESFALGTSMVRAHTPLRKYLGFCVAFSLMTPLGITIGIIVNSYAAHDSIISNILVSIASGTFLYVAIVEVILPEFARRRDKIAKLVLILIGYVAMALLAKWA